MKDTMLLTVAEVCEETRMSESFIKREIREKRLPKLKAGRAVRVRRVDLEAWVARRIAGTEKGLSLPNTGGSVDVASHLIEKTMGTRA